MRKVFPAVALGVFAIVMVVVFMSFRPAQESTTPLKLDLPEKWQEFTRAANVGGKEALDAFQKEHEKKISWKDGVRGEYSDGKAKFAVWIAGAVNDGHAAQMVTDMTNKIGAANPTFKQPATFDFGAVKGYKTDGQGNVNYFYAKGRQVYWIGVNGAADPDALVKRLLPDF